MAEVLSFKKTPLKKLGCSRLAGAPHSLAFHFNRVPSDEEMRFIDDVMARAAAMVVAVTEDKP